MTATLLTFPVFRAFDSNGAPLAGGLLYSYQAGTTTPLATYVDQAGVTQNTNPVVLDSTGTANVWLGDSTYKLVLKDKDGVQQWSVDNVADSGVKVLDELAGSSGSSLVGFKQAGTGAVLTTAQSKMRESVSIVDFGGQAGTGDNTSAISSAAQYLNDTFGGGTILIPYAGEWRMNWVCNLENISIEGPGGRGEYETQSVVIRPYSLASPAITFANGSKIIRYCSMHRIHISGTLSSGSDAYKAINNAPYAILINGGSVGVRFNDCVFYNGVKTVGIIPFQGATEADDLPVTGCTFNDCIIRNDVNDSDNARAIYSIWPRSNAYNTDNKFIGCKVNGPALGYAAEFGGPAESSLGGLFHNISCYYDVKPDHGIYLTGASALHSWGSDLDAGEADAVVIETSESGYDLSRFFIGTSPGLGGQKWKSTDGTFSIPTYSDTAFFKAFLSSPFVGGAITFGSASGASPYDGTVTLNADNDGVAVLDGGDFYIKKSLQIWGNNVAASGYLTAITTGGGISVEAVGTNQDVRLLPSGTGNIRLGGASTYPTSDNIQSLGLSGQRWSVVYAGTGTINTSDEREKQQIRDISEPEKIVALKIKSMMKAFKFNTEVFAQGDKAPIRFGVIAQEVIKAFASEGLDAESYGMIDCSGDIYGIRYDELLSFIIAAI